MMIFCVFFAKSNLTPGGLGLIALRLGPDEMAAQEDLPVTAPRKWK